MESGVSETKVQPVPATSKKARESSSRRRRVASFACAKKESLHRGFSFRTARLAHRERQQTSPPAFSHILRDVAAIGLPVQADAVPFGYKDNNRPGDKVLDNLHDRINRLFAKYAAVVEHGDGFQRGILRQCGVFGRDDFFKQGFLLHSMDKVVLLRGFYKGRRTAHF